MVSRSQWFIVSGIVVVLAGLLGAGLAFSPDLFLVAAGSNAPNFVANRVRTGDLVTLDEYRGNVMVLNIWATWCGPCEREMPSLERLHRSLGPEGLLIVAVSVDESGSEHVLEWVEERSLTFEILHDPTGKIGRSYQTTGLPESFIINRHGVIVKKEIGALEWDSPNQEAFIRRLLADAE